MLKVKTYIQMSKVHGIGLFAGEDIPEGTTVWEFEPGLDISITKEQYRELPSIAKTFFDQYGYWSDELNCYICAADNWRFTNHSKEPNVGTVGAKTGNEGKDIALHTLTAGEELLFDYRTFGEDPE